VNGEVWVVGTWDTKSEELSYIAAILRARGLRAVTVDVGTRTANCPVEIPAREVAGWHAGGANAVFGTDRGASVQAMSQALIALVRDALRTRELAGMIAVGGSGGTSIIAPAMRLLPIGKPKLMISTLASGDVRPFVDVVDMTMMFPVTDIAGLNRLSRVILANAANAMAGMVLGEVPPAPDQLPSIGCTMFGVTTPCVQRIRAGLADSFDVQVFHANGPGGRAMEALAASGMLQGIVDITTTEVIQNLVGGVCDAGPGRLAAASEHGLPWVGSVGAMDMVNWYATSGVPERFRNRRFHVHNAEVTLMRTTRDELAEAGRRLADKLNACAAPVRLVLPLKGLSALDAPGQPFFDPEADQALFDAIRQNLKVEHDRRLVVVDAHINEPEFAEAVLMNCRECLKPDVESARIR